MGQITRFAVRNNGRVLTDVRRPVAAKPARVKVERPPEADVSRIAAVDPDQGDVKVKPASKKSDG